MGMIEFEPTRRLRVAQVERWGTMMGGSALTLYGLSRRSLGGMAVALLGSGLVYRGLTLKDGHVREALGMETPIDRAPSASIPHGHGVKVIRSVIVRRSPKELYNFWRHLENLPRFMDHVKSVRETEPLRSHWVAKAPAGMTVEWDAEIVNDIPDELIGWRSLPNADVPNAGSVHFEPLGSGQRTKVEVVLKYDPPAGPVGDVFAKLFGQAPSQIVRADLYRFKKLMEMEMEPA